MKQKWEENTYTYKNQIKLNKEKKLPRISFPGEKSEEFLISSETIYII